MSGTNAIIAQRVDSGPPATDEITALAESAGYTVLGECTQVRAEDPGTYLGRGKVAELAEVVERTEARIVIVDGGLTPAQNRTLQEKLPDDTQLLDRYRLVLDLFGDRATTRRAKLQVELAGLRYDLPRIVESSDAQHLNIALEKGTRVQGANKRIREIERKLEELPDPAEQARKRRREEGFDLVTVAGYTNAGKSTLLHRLADELSLSDRTHPDRTETARIEDRLFETLETTTRRATLDGRPVFLTDTVGFVADLPHWLVESFSETLSEAAAADCVVLVADVSDPPHEFREKLHISLDVLDSQGVSRENVVTALNKVDLLEPNERDHRIGIATEVAPSVLPVSVTRGTNIEDLVARVLAHLPSESAEIEMTNGDDAMALVSWLYDHADVADVEYASGRVGVCFEARPSVAERARAKAGAIDARPDERR